MYKGYIVEVKNLRKHENADRLQIATFFGNDTVVDLSVKVGDIGIYLPVDGQLSAEFAELNNLTRRKDAEGNQVGGFLDPDKRNIKAIRLRGEKSDGLYLPISCLDYCFLDIKGGAAMMFNVGDTIEGVVNGHDICRKYIPRSNHRTSDKTGNKTRKHREPIAPLFAEHADTEQLAYNLEAFKPGDEIEITLKMHGTSQRTGYLPVFAGYKDSAFRKFINNVRFYVEMIRNRMSVDEFFDSLKHDGVPIYEWGYVSGTRRVVLENYEGGFYGSNSFREQHSKVFEGKLWKGETVYYEVVGFTDAGIPIMSECSNKKVQDKEFSKMYGDTTVFSYGCNNTREVIYPDGTIETYPVSDIYVYRMTMTNEDGDVVEYTPDFMRYRCEQMGVKTVPVLWKGKIPEHPGSAADPTISAGEWIKNVAERYYDGPDPIGKTHIREGVVVRILNKPKFTAYKHKNFAFKVLEGIIKESAAAPDMEEEQEIKEV